MSSALTIRNLQAHVKQRLRVRAAQHGRSMEEEARVILSDAVSSEEEPVQNLAEAVRALFQPLGGVKLDLPQRDAMREPPRFR
jgi:plasmid stability protein